MKNLLTKKQREKIEWAAKNCHTVALFTEWSLSGASMTVRYRAQWVENTRWGPTPRYHTGMILSHTVAPFEDDPNKEQAEADAIATFEAKKNEAYRLFNELREAR